ncbi:MAG TPA: MtrAB system histidine kinase MtrB, partial [Streptosporangiaceae bacterium]|nr:MtrAB system histidine kinase MtrB [Streptosporangiaceae bacterium]
LVVVVLGFVLMQEIAQNIITGKEKSAANVAAVGLATAQNWPGVGQPKPGPGANQLTFNIAKRLETGESNSGTDFAVIVTLRPSDEGDPAYSRGAAVGFAGSAPAPPASLVARVEQRRNSPSQMEFVPAEMKLAGQPRTPGLVFGAPFGAGAAYELYYYFPLTDEQASLGQAQRTLLLVGLAVVVLLAGIAWLVTRWVVIPVRLAAHGALRLSTGQLDQRMAVRGSDELAALATSFNQMAASLQDKLRELEDLSQVQRQFVSDVSHELRTPLTTIMFAADVLFAAREDLSAAPARSAELLQSQLERFEELLTDLLEISRYDANAATLDPEPVDICDVARQSADVAQQLAERRGTKIEFRLPAEPCIAEMDRRRVERILRNLLVNAVEHGENREAIVTVAADSGAVAVVVRDFGVGLRPGEEQLVFDRFWRADPARARTTGGTGLGLSIALEDARLHGGWLEAWGEPGRGSAFRLTLPRVAGEELVGSPLPLAPIQADLDAVVVGLPSGPGLDDPGPADAPAPDPADADRADVGPAGAAPAGAAPAGTVPAGTVPDRASEVSARG